MRYSWIDLLLYVAVAIVLIPLVLRLVETVLAAFEGATP